jgi:hypothetical protein
MLGLNSTSRPSSVFQIPNKPFLLLLLLSLLILSLILLLLPATLPAAPG